MVNLTKERGPGRPPLPEGEGKTARMQIRLQPALKDLVYREASRAHLSANEAAEQALELWVDRAQKRRGRKKKRSS